MALLLSDTDFVGKFELPKTSFNISKLNEVIDDVEITMLKKLLGVDLYTLFIADIDTVTKKPATAKYLNLYNEISTTNIFSDQLINKGMLHALKCFVYFDFAKDNSIKITPVGNTSSSIENGQNIGNTNSIAAVYNQGIEGFRIIQQYIDNNSGDYPEYKYTELDYEYFL